VKSLVVDASVAVKWLPLFSGELHAARATAFLESSRRNHISLLVPDLFWPEVANVLCKAVRRHACNAGEAKVALVTLEAQGLLTIPSLDLIKSALDIATRYSCSLYDSVYIALAMDGGCDLITADEKLANAVGGQWSVTWLANM
jgi:predicted nucleic acid-binding protein